MAAAVVALYPLGIGDELAALVSEELVSEELLDVELVDVSLEEVGELEVSDGEVVEDVELDEGDPLDEDTDADVPPQPARPSAATATSAPKRRDMIPPHVEVAASVP